MSQNEDTPHRDIALLRLAHAMRVVAMLDDSAHIVNVNVAGYPGGSSAIQVRPATFRRVIHPPYRVRIDPDFKGDTHFNAKIDGIEWSAVQQGVSS